MANNILGKSAEVTGGVTKVSMQTVANSGRLALRLGGNVAQRVQPGYVSPDVLARQAILRRFEGRFGVAGNLIDLDPGSSEPELEDRISSTAADIVERGLADEHTTVELRPALPEDALRNPVLNARRENVLKRLQQTLRRDHDVTAIPNIHPIIPSQYGGSPVDANTTWGAITEELDGFLHQMRSGRNPSRGPQQRLAMVAITGHPYTQAIFGDQAPTAGDRPAGSGAGNGLLVLEHVGKRPEENQLAETR